MNRGYRVFLLVLLLAAGGYSQTPSPTPKTTPPDDSDVVKISTNLIQIDVSVTDPSGKPVTDLRRDEIEVYENGQKQKITNFSFVSSIRELPATPKAEEKGGVPVPPPVLRAEQVRRTIALVVDDLSLSFESAYQTRRSLKKFVDEQMQDGDLVAIVRTGAGIGALQQFTSDKRLLYAAIEKVKWNPMGTGGVSAFAPIENAGEPDAAAADEAPSEDIPAASGAGQSLEDFRSSVFATGTLGALRYIVMGMSQLPGRKSVIMFSDGFKLLETDESGAQTPGRVLEFLRQLVDLANRSSIVFYTVDARGLVATGLTAADASPGANPEAMMQALSARNAQLADTQEGLAYLADETGGFSVRNNNDLSGGVKRVLDDQSYYLVGYEPDSDTFDPAKLVYNQLSVKVLRKGVTVRYRSGFFNVADKAEKPASAPAPATPAAQLETALVSPFAVGGVGLRLNALFGSDEKSGSYVRSLLHINAADLKFTDERDGSKKASFDVLAMSFGDNGQIVDQLARGYSLSLKPEAFKKVEADGFVYSFVFPVKRPGAYQFRVALRDSGGGKVGSASQFIEVPDLKKGRLTTSSIILENLTADQWRKFSDPLGVNVVTSPMSDTALRKVRTGTVIRYGYEIYNARLDASKLPDLETKVRVFRDGKVILDGKQSPFELRGQTNMRSLRYAGAIAIGPTMMPGDYILQIIVTDKRAKAGQQIASQYVQFEVVQ